MHETCMLHAFIVHVTVLKCTVHLNMHVACLKQVCWMFKTTMLHLCSVIINPAQLSPIVKFISKTSSKQFCNIPSIINSSVTFSFFCPLSNLLVKSHFNLSIDILVYFSSQYSKKYIYMYISVYTHMT